MILPWIGFFAFDLDMRIAGSCQFFFEFWKQAGCLISFQCDDAGGSALWKIKYKIQYGRKTFAIKIAYVKLLVEQSVFGHLVQLGTNLANALFLQACGFGCVLVGQLPYQISR